MRKVENGQPRQVWLYGGIQLIEVEKNHLTGKLGHLGIMAENQQEALKKSNNTMLNQCHKEIIGGNCQTGFVLKSYKPSQALLKIS